MSMLETALDYARRCWPVGPAHTVVEGRCSCGNRECRSPGKHPRTEHGLKDATTDERRLRDLFPDEVPSNILIRTGPVAGRTLVVVDIDPRHDGHRSLAALEDRHGDLPVTPTGRTGGGGSHYFFWSKAVVRCSAGKVGPGIDIKADGGYVIGPPSMHASGGQYQWAVGRGPDVTLAELPEWLERLCMAGEAPRAAEPVGEEIGAGQRNSVLMSIAGTMRRRGLGYGPILAALMAVNAEQCRPPLEAEEVEAIARSAQRYAPEEPPAVEWAEDERPPESGVVAVLDGAGLAAPLPHVDYLCEEMGLVGGGGAPHLLAGYGFSGKTVAAQAMVLALVANRSVWGAWRSARAFRVLHVDLEQGDRLTRQRYQRLAKAMGLDLGGLGEGIGVACMPRLTLKTGEEGRWRELMTGRDLVVIDSLRAATGGMDENESTIREPLDTLGRLSEETGCRAMVILHAKKGSDETDDRFVIRGSGAIFDAADCAYVFSAKKGEPIEVKQVKARSHGEPVEDFALVIEDVMEKAGLSIKVHGKELVAQRRGEAAVEARAQRARRDGEEILAFVRQHPGLGAKELRMALGLSGDRFTAGVVSLGERIEVRPMRVGHGLKQMHYARRDV